jgi:hypothetical protein
MARSAPLIPPTEVSCGPAWPGLVRTPDPRPVVGAHINLAADTDRIGTRLMLDNVVSDADHVLATHRRANTSICKAARLRTESRAASNTVRNADNERRNGKSSTLNLHATAAIPRFSTRDRSLRAGPEGRFSPRSHLLTKFGITLR